MMTEQTSTKGITCFTYRYSKSNHTKFCHWTVT